MSIKLTTQSTITLLLMSFILTENLCSQNSNCLDAYTICSLDNYHFNKFTSSNNHHSFNNNWDTKGHQIIVTNSKWLSWEIKIGGRLDFDIIPNDQDNDIDFVLYKTVKNNCSKLIATRIMMAGNNFENESSVNCLGNTGLNQYAHKTIEPPGCNNESYGYLKSINTRSDEKYYLMINNYKSIQGFTFVLSGDAELKKNESCIDKEDKPEISIHPNPASNVITIHFKSPNSLLYNYEVIDLFGHLKQKGRFRLYNGLNSYTLVLNDPSPSSNFIRISNSGQTHVIRLVII